MNTVPDLSPRYYIAETGVWVVGAVLLLSKFVGFAPSQSVPILNVTLEQSQHFPRVVGAVFVAALVYLLFEWNQSPVAARASGWVRARALASVLWGGTVLWLSFDILVHGTSFASTSPGWYVALILVGCVLGMLADILILSALLIRDETEAARLRLPRVPAAARAQFVGGGPLLLIVLVAYQVIAYWAPATVRALAPVLTGIPLLVILVAGAVNNRKAFPGIREATDAHDYMYKLHREQPSIAAALKGSETGNAQPPFDMPEYQFKAQLEEEVALRFFVNGAQCTPNDPGLDAVRVERSGHKGGCIAVSVQVHGVEVPPRKLMISIEDVEAGASAYLRRPHEAPALDVDELLSHALNYATILAMERRAGPPLIKAAQFGFESELLAALKTDADVNERAEAGWTALLYASANNHPRLVQHLLEAGANPDLSNWLGRSPLMFAAGYGYEEVCSLLIEHGANLNLVDEQGETALMVAITRGKPAVAYMLINAGADITVRSRENRSALDLAHRHKQGSVAKALRHAGPRST
jgi:hypothetical protein